MFRRANSIFFGLLLVSTTVWGQPQSPNSSRPLVQQPRNQPVGSQPVGNQQQLLQQQQSAAQPQQGQGQPVKPNVVQNAPTQPFQALEPAHQQYLDKVLDVWEQRTAAVERYRCDFRRYEMDPGVDQANAKSVAEGSLKFMQPDKGLFRVDKLAFHAGLDENKAPKYRENERQKFGEYWICDGEYVHILDRNEKKATKVQLPPEMRGQQIYLSPLPFLFGVKAAEIKTRYWIRPIIPAPQGSTDVWLEAWPKRLDDAGNYSRVQIVLDRTDVLPKALIVLLPHWTPEQPHKEIYEFSNREVNWSLLDRIRDLGMFKEEFIPTTLPKDWTVVVQPYEEAPQQAGQLQDPAAPTNGPARVAQPINSSQTQQR